MFALRRITLRFGAALHVHVLYCGVVALENLIRDKPESQTFVTLGGH